MAVCGLIESGFMIAIGVSLLLSGLVVYYVRGQIAIITKAIDSQQMILSQFIADVKSSTGTMLRESPSQLNRAVHHPTTAQTKEEDEVSESSSESDDDCDVEENHHEERPGLSLNVASLQDIFNGRPENSSTKVEVADLISDTFSLKDSDSESDAKEIINYEQIRKAKVGELRDMVSEKLGWDESEAKKAKKAELVEALIKEC